VGLFFGRAAAELGQLTQPPPLGSFSEEEEAAAEPEEARS
jgi:hypothetical protein